MWDDDRTKSKQVQASMKDIQTTLHTQNSATTVCASWNSWMEKTDA